MYIYFLRAEEKFRAAKEHARKSSQLSHKRSKEQLCSASKFMIWFICEASVATGQQCRFGPADHGWGGQAISLENVYEPWKRLHADYTGSDGIMYETLFAYWI